MQIKKRVLCFYFMSKWSAGCVCCKLLHWACSDFVKKTRKKETCFMIPFSCSNNDIMMINYPTLHKCSISAAIMMCQWHHVHRSMMILTGFSLSPPLSPSVPPYCRSCSLSCCPSSFQPSCSLTPAPRACSTSRRPTTSRFLSSPRLASIGPRAWFVAHRIMPTP